MHATDAKRGKTCAGNSRLVLVSFLIGQENGARVFSQSQSVALQNQSNREITFNNQLKTVLPTHWIDVLFKINTSCKIHEISLPCTLSNVSSPLSSRWFGSEYSYRSFLNWNKSITTYGLMGFSTSLQLPLPKTENLRTVYILVQLNKLSLNQYLKICR